MLSHDAWELVDHAAALHYNVLALTLHGRLYCPEELRDYAWSRGILMIPGIEFYLEQREVLLLGVTPEDLKHLKRFDDLIALKKERNGDLLVIAPHPFYTLGKCLGDKLESHRDAFDAIEFCHFYTSWWNPNHRAEAVSRRIGKPMLACSDTHQLKWMNHHYSLVEAKPARADVFAAIRAGHIRNVSRPLSAFEIAGKTFWHFAVHDPQKWARDWGWISARISHHQVRNI